MSDVLRIKVKFLLIFLLLAALNLGAGDWDWQSRDTWQKPNKVLETVGVKPGMVIGEPGAGQGYFTLKLARKVGPTGKIYANDIIKKYLDSIKKKARKEGLTNIVTIKGKETDPLFPGGQMDMVFMCLVLHDLTRPVAFLKNLKPCLKPNAPLVIIEQDPEKTGSTSGHFWQQAKILETVKAAGYKLDRIETFLPRDNIYFYYAE